MDFRIQNKSTAVTPTPLNYNNNGQHSSPPKHSSPLSHQEKQDLAAIPHHHQNLVPELSSFTPSPTIDHASNQRSREDSISNRLDPTQIPVIQTTPTPPNKIRYRECLKNHAAHMGSHVVDGCGEFMPEDGDHHQQQPPTAEPSPTAAAGHLLCAACGCHRNFHRKETESGGDHHSIITLLPSNNNNSTYKHHHHHKSPSILNTTTPHHHFHNPSPLQQTPMSSSIRHHHFPPQSTIMTFTDRRGTTTESSSEDLNLSAPEYGGGGGRFSSSSNRKRFRTKFSQEQKLKMMEFADKIGWRISKPDEVEVQQFCCEVGVKRKVFKVWMHNNKQAMKRRDSS